MARVFFVLALFLVTALRCEAHVVLDGNSVQPLMAEIARNLSEARHGATEEVRLEALYGLGERAQSLADLMNLEVTSHGESPYAELLVQRLEEHGVRIRRVGRSLRYDYDMAAFRDYLEQSPRGKRAADASFRLVAQTFYNSTGAAPADLIAIDVDQLRAAIRREEAFLKEHPQSDKVKDVRFFLAVDLYRVSRHSRDAATVREYKQRAARALKQFLTDYPGTAEARMAQMILGR